MKLAKPWTGAAAAVAGSLVVVAAGVYTVDCRMNGGSFDEKCYIQGIFSVLNKDLLLSGALGAGGFALGWNIPNPRLDEERRQKLMGEIQTMEGGGAPGPSPQPPGVEGGGSEPPAMRMPPIQKRF
jgi:hypothetical protein